MQIRANHLKTFQQKSDGLLKFEKAEPVYFETRWGVHTFFMKFSIDVVVLDDTNKIVKLKENLKPNRVFVWKPVFKNVLELPAGSIEKLRIKKGDKIKLHLTS